MQQVPDKWEDGCKLVYSSLIKFLKYLIKFWAKHKMMAFYKKNIFYIQFFLAINNAFKLFSPIRTKTVSPKNKCQIC